MLIIYSFWVTLFESLKKKECGFFKVFNTFLQFLIILFHFIRYTKFIEVKRFFFDNKDIYDNKNEKYFPNKVFNIDGFLLALSINIFIFNFLFSSLENKPSCYETKDCSYDCLKCLDYLNYQYKTDYYVFVFIFILIPLYITFFTLSIIDILNDKKIGRNYDKLIYNWNLYPIKSIQKIYESNFDKNDNNYLELESAILKLERLNYYNYINLFSNKNGKICGKDNYGNDIYFPLGFECPINKIFVSEIDENLPGYHKLVLGNRKFLYYSNESIESKIVIDLRTDDQRKIPLNPKYSNDLTNIPFYEEIYYNSINEHYLYSINYLGINTSSISGDKIKYFKHKMKVYKSLSKGKLALFCIMNIFLLLGLIILFLYNIEYLSKNHFEIIVILLMIFSIIDYIINFIFISICLGIHVKYITRFMNKINLDFEREKNDFKWNFIILMYYIFFLVIPSIIYLEDYFDKNYPSKKVSYQYNPTNEASKEVINRKNEEIKQLNNDIKQKDKKIYDLQNEMEKLKNNSNMLTINNNNTPKIEEYIEKNNELNQTIHGLINDKNQIEKELKLYKLNIPFELKEGEELMCIILQSFDDQNIHYPFLCKKTLIFNNLENLIYKKLPELKDDRNFFLHNSFKVNKYETLEQNRIRDGDIIILNKHTPEEE